MDNDFATGYALGTDSGNNGNGGFGGMFGEGLWAIIILAMLGFGRGGFGFGGGFNGVGEQGGTPCATQADVRAAVDQQTLISKLDQQTYGLADSTYALNNAITNGFHGVDNAICNLGFQTQQGFSGLASQMASCCCETQRLIERGFCDTNYNAATNTANIIQAGHCDTDRVIAKLTDMEAARQAEKIEALRLENQSLKFAASQAAQNTYLVDQLRPCPIPAYITCSPFAAAYGYGGYNGYGNNGCGCGCG